MFRKYLALFLVLCIGMSLCACQQKQQEEEAPAPEMKTVYTFEKSIRPVSMHAQFGKVALIADGSCASEGEKSIQLQPLGTSADQLYVYFPLRSDILVFNYTDLNYIDSFQLDVYAPVDMNLGVGLYFSSAAELKVEEKQFALIQGWNTITMPVQHSLISLQYDLADCYGIYAHFEEGSAEKGEHACIDNIQAQVRREPVEVEQNILLNETADYCELADFEHAYQQIIVSPYTTYNRAQLPDVKVVKAAEYGIEAPSGEKVLRVESYPSTNYGVGQTWTQMAFADKWFETLDISRFAGEDYYLKFSIYQESDITVLLELNLYHAYGMDWGGVTSVKGQWVEYSAPLSNFTNWMNAPRQFVFSWEDWNPALGDSCVFYIDNIRLEKAS